MQRCCHARCPFGPGWCLHAGGVSLLGMGIMRQAIADLMRTDAEREAAELKETSRNAGATTIDCCHCGEVVTVCGPLRSVTLRPAHGVASVEAELYDGSGRISLIWLGRREIRGIEPGRLISATGRLTRTDGGPTIYNPRYTLRHATIGQ